MLIRSSCQSIRKWHEVSQQTFGAGQGRAAVALALVVGAALLLLRQRGPGAFDTLWAEDGEIFLQGALEDSSVRGWLRSYAGYMHLAPRALASIFVWFPVEWAPLLFSGSAALLATAIAVITYCASEKFIPSRMHRAVLAFALLVLPAAGLEVANATANIHWYLLYAMVWASLWRPERSGERLIGSGVLFVTAASDPFAVLVAPVLGWRLLRTRERVDWIFAGALGTGLLLQAGVIGASAGSRPLDPFATSPAVLATWYGFHVLEGAVFGVVLRDALNEAWGVAAVGALALLVLSILLAPAARAAARLPKLVPITLLGLHLGLFFLPVILAGISTSRYAVTPIMLLYALVAWGLANDDTSLRRPLQRLAIGILAVLAVVDFAPWNPRAEGPRWSEGLAEARSRCASDRQGSVEIQIPPRAVAARAEGGAQGRAWGIRVPCRSLQSPGSS